MENKEEAVAWEGRGDAVTDTADQITGLRQRYNTLMARFGWKPHPFDSRLTQAEIENLVTDLEQQRSPIVEKYLNEGLPIDEESPTYRLAEQMHIIDIPDYIGALNRVGACRNVIAVRTRKGETIDDETRSVFRNTYRSLQEQAQLVSAVDPSGFEDTIVNIVVQVKNLFPRLVATFGLYAAEIENCADGQICPPFPDEIIRLKKELGTLSNEMSSQPAWSLYHGVVAYRQILEGRLNERSHEYVRPEYLKSGKTEEGE